MKYLLTNAYSAKNRGDAGIVIAMINLLRERDPDADIYVMSSHSYENKEFYSHYNVKSVPAIWEVKSGQSLISRYLNGINLFVKAHLKPNDKSFKYYHKADLVISVGGGYLYSSRRGPLGLGLLSSLYHIWLSCKFAKPVLAFPQSVGPLYSNIDKFVVKTVLKKVKKFFSREPYSTELLKDLGIENVSEVSDVGFTLAPKNINNNDKHFKSNHFPKIGITVMDWRFSRPNSTDEDVETYLNKLALAFKEIKKEYPKAHLYIYPQVTVGAGDTDLDASLRLQSKILNQNATVVDLELLNPTPDELVAMYGDMDFFIGSRMHSTIFAIAGGTPTIALSYQPKTMGTFKIMGLEEYALDIEKFKTSELVSIVKSSLVYSEFPIERVQNKVNENKVLLLGELDEYLTQKG
ncbi:polysaccharide pyruvyl transferase family protein [Bacillus sp. Cs-700]|uniref:polysaccharide pyruvyl transferase family protein n=1 Tax=Bacillus sp. Cs-700 TaxID=2589818 RepID=UPI00140B9135|nr:polysaccharide pyruvyl transferase family protein [Bacillus sp. Cs-700]